VRKDGFHLIKRINGSLYLANCDHDRVISAAPISPEIWSRLAELQVRYEKERRAWHMIQPHENDPYVNDWSMETAAIVRSIRRHGGTGRMLERAIQRFTPTTIYLEVGGARVSAEGFQRFGLPNWFDRKKFEETVAAL